MALWGNKDNLNIGAAGTVYVSDWDTNTVTGSGTTFTNFAAGDVIRFGDFKGTYYGDAVIKSISSNTVLTIASTEGLDPNLGVFATGYGATTFVVSQLPVILLEIVLIRNQKVDIQRQYMLLMPPI